MMNKPLELPEFLDERAVIFDSRSPQEYSQGHIPSALNLPLLNDQGRSDVGLTYKRLGRQAAFAKGLDWVSADFEDFLNKGMQVSASENLHFYCARGGMRSFASASAFQFCGKNCGQLRGGYKTFRNWVLKTLDKPLNLRILGGFTGSRKTQVLQDMKELGTQVIDLENLAKHKGSAFGSYTQQPSNEQFENSLAWELRSMNLDEEIWIEDESRLIGTCAIPKAIFEQMQHSPLFEISLPDNERLRNLSIDYQSIDPNFAIEALNKIKKRLGSLRYTQCSKLIQEGKYQEACKILSNYYDTSYTFHLKKRKERNHIHHITLTGSGLTPQEWAKKILETKCPKKTS